MNDDVKQVLTKARKLIEIGWTRGANARNNRQRITPITSPDATCFCIHGAVCRATHDLQLPDEISYRAMDRLDAVTPGGVSAVFFNDQASTKTQVLDLIDKAIAS